MSKQVILSIKSGMDKLQKDMDKMSLAMQSSVNAAVQGIAEAAYASITAEAQSQLGRTRQDYLSALSFEKLEDGSFIINLDGDFANKLEDGYSPFNMVPGMLASNSKVSAGSRAGEPWVKKAKDGHKYAHVPLGVKPNSEAAKTSNMADAMKSLMGQNARGDVQKMLKTFTGDDGRPMEGKVAVAFGPSVQDPRIAGLVKYQQVAKTAGGKDRVQSIYLVYRTISETGKPWIHPGFSGLKAFDNAEKEIVKQIDEIIKSLT